MRKQFFSTLRRLEIYLRKSTSQNCLNGLTIVNIHHDTRIITDNQLTKTSVKKKSKLIDNY